MFNRKSLLQLKKQTALDALFDKELDIEVAWYLYGEARRGVDQTKKKIDDILEEIEKEKEKTPFDRKKIDRLRSETYNLGFNMLDKKGKKTYKGGIIETQGNAAEFQQNKIREEVAKREYIKLRIKAINTMMRGTFEKRFKRAKEDEFVKYGYGKVDEREKEEKEERAEKKRLENKETKK